ncbi:MAG: PilZ protein [Alphaproteobacteria bacterium]|nr:PilZ protein [Alphaproteobacteria bacterium]
MRLTASLERGSAYDRRQFVRRPVNIGAGLAGNDRPASSIILFDLSTHGCGFEATSHLETGARVWLKLPGLESWPAQIAWAEDGRGGLQFDRPLHISVVERYARMGGPA